MPQNLREKAYFTIVRPAFEYASEISDPYLKRDIKKLDKVQRHAARFVTNNTRKRYDPDEQISVSALLRDLNWESLANRRRDSRCTLMYKLLNDHIDIDPGLRPSYTDSRLRSGERLELKRITTSKSCEPSTTDSFLAL